MTELKLSYCKTCGQMTNHKLNKFPLLEIWECCKCKTEK